VWVLRRCFSVSCMSQTIASSLLHFSQYNCRLFCANFWSIAFKFFYTTLGFPPCSRCIQRLQMIYLSCTEKYIAIFLFHKFSNYVYMPDNIIKSKNKQLRTRSLCSIITNFTSTLCEFFIIQEASSCGVNVRDSPINSVDQMVYSDIRLCEY
jgi:hypothetical protein